MGFKVVDLSEEGLGSWKWMPNRMIYRPGYWTIRNYGWGPLTVFSTYEGALHFVREFSGISTRKMIYSCAYIPCLVEPSDRCLWYLTDTEEVHGSRTKRNQLPRGTRLADAVCLLEPEGLTDTSVKMIERAMGALCGVVSQ